MPPNSLDIFGSWAAARRLCTLPRFESPEAEAEFWKDRDTRFYFFRRWMLLAGILSFLAFLVVDILIVEDNLAEILIVRFAATAIALALWVLFGRDQTPAMREVLLAAMGLVTIVANLVMITIVDAPAADLLPFAISMIMAFGFGLVAPRFRTALWFAIISYTLYWITVPFSNSSFAAVATNAHFLSISVFAALVGTFVREKLEREQWFAKRRLALLNEQAVEMSLAKDRLLASVSHELRTPVNAIAGFSEVMQNEIFGPIEPQRYRGYVDDIHFSATLLKTGIDDLLEVSRIGMQKIAWEDAVTPLSRIVRGSVTICESDALEEGVTIALDSDVPDVMVRTDPHRLTQTLVNIIVNAIKFSERGGIVHVTTRFAEDGGVVIEIVDTGCGIASEDLSRIREPFGQVHADQYSSHKGGLGLGLSIANGFIEMMEGRLDIHSVPGTGTTVSIMIPPHRVENVQAPPHARVALRAVERAS